MKIYNLKGKLIFDDPLDKLRGTNLEGANLRWTDFEGANLRGTNLQGANLRGTNLRGTNLQGTNLQGANLEGANLRGTNLQGANLRGANLRWTDLQGTNLQGADLDFSCLPLSCKGTKIKVDDRFIYQLLFHLTRQDTEHCSYEVQNFLKGLDKDMVNGFCNFRDDLEEI